MLAFWSGAEHLRKLPVLTHCSLETHKMVTPECGVLPGSPLFANSLAIFL